MLLYYSRFIRYNSKISIENNSKINNYHQKRPSKPHTRSKSTKNIITIYSISTQLSIQKHAECYSISLLQKYYLLELYKSPIFASIVQSMKKGSFLLNQASLKPKGEVTLALTVTTPTHDLTSNRYINELVHPQTSYQLIPSIPKTQLFDVQEAILTLLPLSKNRLIDVAMPYIYQQKNKLDEKYFGRYLIFNEQLIGIRLCCFKTGQNAYPNSVIQRWPAGKVIFLKTHRRILDYYRQRQIKTIKKQIPIGDFILSFNNVKIGMLFESEYREDNYILNHYKRAGCQIISVVSDLPREKITHNALQGSTYKANSAFETALKKFCRSTDRIVMYAGVRMAPLGELYLSMSFVLQKQMTQKATEPHMFNDGGSITTICALPRITQTERRIEGTMEEIGFNQIEIPHNLIAGGNIRIGKTEYRTAFMNKPTEPKPITRELTDIYRKLSIWYLHKEINQGEPLAFMLPLTAKTLLMIQDIKAIAKYMDTRPDQMLLMIKNNKFYSPLEEEQALNLHVYEDIQSYCNQFPNKKLYFYTDDESQIKFLAEKAQTNPNILLCHKLMPFQPSTSLNRIQEQRFRKMDKFAQKIISDRIISFSRILIESKDPTWNFNKEEILESIENHLKIKLRIEIRQHPFFTSLLKKDKLEIENLLNISQKQIFNNNDASIYQLWEKSKLEKDKNIIDIEDQNDPKEREEKDRQFWNKMKEQRKLRKEQEKKLFLTCHKCQFIGEKPFFHRCRKCELSTCYLCMQSCLPDKIKSRNDFTQNCIVCSDICKCQTCKKRTQKPILANSAAQSHHNLSIIEQQKHGEKSKENAEEIIYKQSCTACMIMGRTSISIKVYCDKCDKQSCILCIRDKEKNANFTKEWLCQDCRPELPKIVTDGFVAIEDMENGMKERRQKEQSNSTSPHRPINNSRMDEERGSGNNGYNNNRGNWNDERGRGRGRGRGGGNFNNHSRNDNNNYNQNSQNNQNKRKSPSRSNSPIRNPNRKSPSNSASPPRVVNTSFKKAQTRQKSASRSNSPIINRNKPREQSKRRSPSRSGSPVRAKKPQENHQREERKRQSSPSRSKSPVRNNQNGYRKKSNSRSRSRSHDKRQKQEKNLQKPLWKQNSNNSNPKNSNSYNSNGDRPAFERNGSGNGNNYRGSSNNNFSNNTRDDRNRSYESSKKDSNPVGQIIPTSNKHVEEENDFDY